MNAIRLALVGLLVAGGMSVVGNLLCVERQQTRVAPRIERTGEVCQPGTSC